MSRTRSLSPLAWMAGLVLALSPFADAAAATKKIFVIAMENHDSTAIYGNTTDAPYINNVLLPRYAHATNFVDVLPLNIPSEPHYVWMEAGTNAFADHTFTNDAVPSAANSTNSTVHLVTQINNAAFTWTSYQQGITVAGSGPCPIATSGFYAPKHDPFIFFQDVSGAPPSKTNSYCAAHHRALYRLANDLKTGAIADYNFITPDQCNDMHGQAGCPNANTIQAGDNWLKVILAGLIPYVNANNGVIFVVWDEGITTSQVPFLAIGPHIKKGYAGAVQYDHSSLPKTVEIMLGLSVLPTIGAGVNDFADLFVPGSYP